MFGQTKPPVGSRLDMSHPLAQGLVGCWLFNEGGGNTAFNLADQDNGALINAPVWQPTGLKFNGANQYVNIPDSTKYSFTNNAFTITIAGVVATTSVSHTLISKAAGVGTREWQISTTTTGGFYILVGNTSGAWPTLPIYGTVIANKPFIVSMVLNQGYILFYQNGVLVISLVYIGGGLINSTVPVTIGTSSGLSGYTNGTIYHAEIHNRALSPEEIKQLHEQTKGW